MVRFAEERDIPRINELRRQVSELHAQNRPDIFKPGFCQELQDRTYTLLREEESDILIAERDGVICGMAAIEYLNKPESPYCHLRRIYYVTEFGVDEAYRRQGVGRELMAFMEADAGRKVSPASSWTCGPSMKTPWHFMKPWASGPTVSIWSGT